MANPDFIEITEPPLEDRLSAFVRELNGDDEQWRANLKFLAQNIRTALSEDELAETPRGASFFEMLAEIERESRSIAEEEIFTAYLSTLAFCETCLVEWYVLGSGSPANSR